jgi:hypothetical protein
MTIMIKLRRTSAHDDVRKTFTTSSQTNHKRKVRDGKQKETKVPDEVSVYLRGFDDIAVSNELASAATGAAASPNSRLT